jgi:hypothetical protein
LSEFITHMGIYGDCARLAQISSEICDPFKLVLKRHWDIGALGALSRSGDRHPVPLLNYIRDRWVNRRDGDFLEEKLAFVLGWRTHNAADRQCKPLYRELQPEYYKNEVAGQDPDEGNVSDIRIYHDVVVFREVFDCGKRKGLSPLLLQDAVSGHPASTAVAVPAVERAIEGVVQRTLLNTQSFVKKETRPEAWEKRFENRRQYFYVDIHKFARALEAPDPEYLRRFILENNFYDRRDPLIRLARALHTGAATPDIALNTAAEQAKKQSQYAQALRKAYLYLTACSAFFERKMTEEELRPRLDLGTQHYVPRTGEAR